MAKSRFSFSPLGTFIPAGDLHDRLQRNFDRLEEEKYQPDNVFQREKEAANWPGDTEGRTILALVLLSQATGRTPRYLDRILERWPREVNERGYFGQVQPDQLISEQQLSGHGWVLRALSELERWRPGGPARALARPIIEYLILPTRGSHRVYPLESAARRAEGSFSGTHLGRVGNWLLSTDVGCDFICLDGVVDAYQAFGDERLTELIQEMVARFLELDLPAVKAQTHATLTACRALLRWADVTENDTLVAAVAERFELYTKCAWTEHYANYNWFGRPEWTEPCAIVDSLMVAMELWRRTDDTRFLEQAQLIYFNALGHAQRSNGGFGCDNCPGADGQDDVFFKVYEAHWCCTMRGGEGLSRMCQYSLAHSETSLRLPFGLSGQTSDGSVRIDSRYPHEPRLTLTLSPSAQGTPSEVELFIPSWMKAVRATDAVGQTVALVAGERWLRLKRRATSSTWTVEGVFDEGVRPLLNRAAAIRPRVVRYRGPLVLAGKPQGDGIEPIYSAFRASVVDPAASHRRLLVSVESQKS